MPRYLVMYILDGYNQRQRALFPYLATNVRVAAGWARYAQGCSWRCVLVVSLQGITINTPLCLDHRLQRTESGSVIILVRSSPFAFLCVTALLVFIAVNYWLQNVLRWRRRERAKMIVSRFASKIPAYLLFRITCCEIYTLYNLKWICSLF